MIASTEKSLPARHLARAMGAAAMSLGFLLAACDDNRTDSSAGRQDQGAEKVPAVPPKPLPQQAEKRDTTLPPPASPGAAPSAARMIGTWMVLEAKSGAIAGDLSAGTTYRFEAAGKVTVGGSKQCAYILEATVLKVDCGAALATGKVEFRDTETMVWTIADNERITLKKR